MHFRFIAVVALFCPLVCGCNSSTPEQASDTPNSTFFIASWSHYLSPDLLKEFEARHQVEVKVSHYASNEELLAKLQTGASGYDLVFPSDYMVQVMRHLKLLHPIEKSKISAFQELLASVTKRSYDPQNEYSVPYAWGTTGIAVNKKLYPGQMRGWKNLFENEDIVGQFSLLDDGREVLSAALKAKGYSVNTRSRAELEEAKALLLRVRKHVKAFTSEPLMNLVDEETIVAHAYSIDTFQARRLSGGDIQFVVPEEGGIMWIDNFAIPKDSKNPEIAHQFIDFMLQKTNARISTEFALVAPSNPGALSLLPKEFQVRYNLAPDEKTLARFETLENLGDDLALWDRIWTEIKASDFD